MTKATVPAIALLPIRLFFGITFLYAGLDKLLDPAFFDASAPSSLHAQLEGFARLSPLGDLIRASLPLATPIGLLIAVGEIGIGIGTLTGLAYRVAAAGGAAISLLLFLTASWATHPYYLGNDLPYLFGWIALAIAGHGGLLVPRRVIELDELGLHRPDEATREPRPSGRSRRRRLAAREAARVGHGGGAVGFGYDARPSRVGASRGVWQDDEVPSPERRALLQTLILAGAAAVVASFALPLRALGVLTEHGPVGSTPTPTTNPGTAAGPSPTPGATARAGAQAIAKVADVKSAGAAPFTVPLNAPAPLPAGDPGVIVQLADGSFVAYDATCTHQGCTVEYDQPDRLLVCPCHSAVFDPANNAAVLGGPAPAPLTKLPIVVDQASGQIYLSA
ncbi:MAG TPA: Rieske 2Fe-2S domain-containing protein [Candidatus Limnocylindrales bacterium]|nr:Rieske 2Fe-2S domain-containing protein [Candidatus Limnocylindrales bacterium]